MSHKHECVAATNTRPSFTNKDENCFFFVIHTNTLDLTWRWWCWWWWRLAPTGRLNILANTWKFYIFYYYYYFNICARFAIHIRPTVNIYMQSVLMTTINIKWNYKNDILYVCEIKKQTIKVSLLIRSQNGLDIDDNISWGSIDWINVPWHYCLENTFLKLFHL